MTKKTYISIGLSALLLLTGVMSWYALSRLHTMPTSPSVIVFMTDEGFSPAEFSVKAGSRVDFVNKSTTGQYWPASDLHPTHELYSEFDPKEPVMPGKTWSFVFEKTGFWRMHDHLHPDKRGAVTVIP